MEYALVIYEDLNELIREVNARLRIGWQPLGGMLAIPAQAINPDKDLRFRQGEPYQFIQTLVRELPSDAFSKHLP